jgi:hypothetical protein
MIIPSCVPGFHLLYLGESLGVEEAGCQTDVVIEEVGCQACVVAEEVGCRAPFAAEEVGCQTHMMLKRLDAGP